MLSVILLLLAILIPAVQVARESARKAACQNKLRNIALAVQQFHDEQGWYPPGQAGGSIGFGPRRRTWSWLARLLPYIGHQDLYDRGGIPTKTLMDSGIMAVAVQDYLCPSAGGERATANTEDLVGMEVGLTNYKGVSGANWGYDDTTGGTFRTMYRNRGTNGSYDGLGKGDGVLWRSDYLSRLRPSNISDGLSVTFLVGEDLPRHNRWCSWPYANHAYGTCAIPPNHQPLDVSDWRETWSFRSVHPRGLNFALADGSVTFVDERIAWAVYRAMATRDGSETHRLAP
ncbi:MAG: DUF1559 domain-containing protein [Pirellulaceae bacterium]|nr:DUF1559 domain-containing protein [Pirellulaceae bacterium]